MSAVNVQVFVQQVYDPSHNLVNFLYFTAIDWFDQPKFMTPFYAYAGTNDPLASPHPTYISDDDAISQYTSDATTYILDYINNEAGATLYTTINLVKVDPQVGAAIALLTMDTLTDGSSFKKMTAAEKTKLDTLAAVAVSGQYSDLSGLPSIPSAQVNSDWNAVSGVAQIANKPTLASVATSGLYSDLTGSPAIPAAQVNSDWNAISGVSKINNKPSLAAVATSGSYADLTGKPSIPTVQAYEGTSQRLGAFPIIKSATVSSGVAVFNLTNDGTSTGTALFPNGVIVDSVNLTVNDATAAYQMSWAFSNSNKTLTVTANKLTTANILTGILGQSSANSSVIKLQVWGY